MQQENLIRETPSHLISNAEVAEKRYNYQRNESSKIYTHPLEAARPSEDYEEENVGKDHNKVNSFNIYPYSDNDGYQNPTQ